MYLNCVLLITFTTMRKFDKPELTKLRYSWAALGWTKTITAAIRKQ